MQPIDHSGMPTEEKNIPSTLMEDVEMDFKDAFRMVGYRRNSWVGGGMARTCEKDALMHYG